MVMARFAGTTPYRPVPGVPGGGGTATVVCLKAGKYFDTGSVSSSRPSSSRIATATVVTAFDMEAMRRMTSLRMGRFFSTSIFP